MNSIFKMLAALSVVTILLNGATYAQETGFSPIERELAYLMHIWPGDYDNQEQVSFDERAQGKSTLNHIRVHTKVTKIEKPKLGKNVLYIEEYHKNDPLNKQYHWFYSLSADEESTAVRASVYLLKNTAQLKLLSKNPTELAKIRVKDLAHLKGCDFLIRRDAYIHHGIMENGNCMSGKEKENFNRQIQISKTTFSILHTTGNSEENTHWWKMIRARWFACMVDVPKDTPGRANHTQHYIKIHDQGGTFSFTHPDGRDMTLLMRNTWSYGMQRETFFIGVLEGDVNGPTLVYAWGEPGTDRIGMNPGYIRIQCDLDTKRNVNLQKGLREES